MTSIFSPDGTLALRAAVQGSALLAFDFDGTLAPIVDDPADAVASPETVELLRELTARFQVAVVSGRATRDLVARLGFEPTYIVGNHGAEGNGDAPEPDGPAAQWLRTRVAAAAPTLRQAGVSFEDKGFSWTLHYRQAPDHEAALQEIKRLLGDLPAQLQAFDGKCCVNVVMADAPTKGRAMEALVARTGASHVVFIGDDVTDETVYRLARPSWVTIHVGRTAQPTGARFYVDTQRDVVAVLRRLLALASPAKSK